MAGTTYHPFFMPIWFFMSLGLVPDWVLRGQQTPYHPDTTPLYQTTNYCASWTSGTTPLDKPTVVVYCIEVEGRPTTHTIHQNND